MTVSLTASDGLPSFVTVYKGLYYIQSINQLMTFTQISFDSAAAPNVWERHYSLADGTVAVISHSSSKGDFAYAVTRHSSTPTPGAWWDTVTQEVTATDDLRAAEKAVASLS